MKNLRHLLAVASLLFAVLAVSAQDSTRFKQDSSVRRDRDTAGNRSDTARWRRGSGGGMASLFADSAKLTSSDYQLQIEKTYVTLNNVDNKSDLGLAVGIIKSKLADTDSVLAVLKDNILNNSRALNLRNLQVFRSLLLNIQLDLKEHRELLDSTGKEAK
jgi:potassium efflux system protein